MKVYRLNNVFSDPPLPDDDYVLLSESQAEIDELKGIIKAHGELICKKCYLRQDAVQEETDF